MKDIFFTFNIHVMELKTGGKNLEMKDIYFTFNLPGIQLKRFQNFRNKGNLFYFNDMQIKR